MNPKDIPKYLNDITPEIQLVLTEHHQSEVGQQARWKLTGVQARWDDLQRTDGKAMLVIIALNGVSEKRRWDAFKDIRNNNGYVVIEYNKA